jgi:DNA-binding IclR family transcriptional regulator
MDGADPWFLFAKYSFISEKDGKLKMPKGPTYPVPALEKGLDIIETLAAATEPQSLAELAARLERSSSELFRMLACLEQRGYLAREEASGKYALTLKLYALTHAHSPMVKLLGAARRPMQDLTEKIGESCHLSVLDRGKLLVVAQQESPARVRLSIEVGGEFDPVATASGRLLLSALDDATLAEALAASPVGKTLGGRALAGFRSGLGEIARSDVSMAESETIEGVRDVAVRVGWAGAGGAALAVTRLMKRGSRGDEAALVKALQATAAEITRTLGLSNP